MRNATIIVSAVVAVGLGVFCGTLVAESASGEQQDNNNKGSHAMSEDNDGARVVKTDEQWREALTPEQYHILREKGTETAFEGKYWDHKGDGIYKCAGCGQLLFDSRTKFKSGSGWPSYYQPIELENVLKEEDDSLGMHRVEVLCSRCGGHLGHVFGDGPQPTGLRYCINSAALNFVARDQLKERTIVWDSTPMSSATFAAGCFWGVENAFSKLKGVKMAISGYTGGTTENPTYEQVCSGKTGHAEAVRVIYDPREVTYEQLLEVFWNIHNPTTKNRQGPDVGTQYRSAIFYHDENQLYAAQKTKEKLEKSGKYDQPVVTEITPASTFYKAEEYHQRYFEKHGESSCHAPSP